MEKKDKNLSIIHQIALLFGIVVLLTGLLTYFVQLNVSETAVKAQVENYAESDAQQVIYTIEQYPAHVWLLKYWYDNWDDMDIEYDAEYTADTETAKKSRILSERHPDLQLKYATSAEIDALPEKDQKLYAEVVYSWLLTEANRIKRAQNIAYLFCVISDAPYDKQFFVFSAAEPGVVRGTGPDDAYTVGKQVDVRESQQNAMLRARENTEHLADAGDYVDYYTYMGTYDAHPVFVGLTYDLSVINSNIRNQTAQRTAFAMLFQVALALIFMLLILKIVINPLKKVQASIQLYKETKDSELTAKNLGEIESRNEIGRLSDDVTDLTHEIDDYIDKIETITTERERIGAELELASKIQINSLPNIFPPFPERDEFDIYASMKPAKEVGGDFYDFFMIDDDHLALLIADVSGKGVPAALFMMTSKIMINNAAVDNISPGEILKAANNQICASNPEEMFVSVWMGVLEISTGKVTAANAGHEYPAVLHPGGRFELMKARHGFVIGGMEDLEYQEHTIQLEPGSKIFLYTDGVPEATNIEGKMFGMDRMVVALNKDTSGGPREIMKRVKDAVNEFDRGAEQFDDLTMMCMTYNGPHKLQLGRTEQGG